MDKKRRNVVVTGATGGLGPAVVESFRASGDAVITVSRKHADISADLTKPEEVERAFREIVEAHRSVDVLVHVMGGFASGGTIEETEPEIWQRMLNLNLLSAVYAFHAVIPLMRELKQGRLIAVGSRAGLHPSPGLSAYSVSKAALHSLVQTAAAELVPHGITVNAVLPGTIRTNANLEAMGADKSSTWVEPSSIAQVIHHLASHAAANVSGALIPVYGRS
ncbi:MAG: SDR family oxidoreductase [Bryobacteraceae bacterium]|nr:SDR family oxidoreductase [Bryobacteraceae bacterium]